MPQAQRSSAYEAMISRAQEERVRSTCV